MVECLALPFGVFPLEADSSPLGIIKTILITTCPQGGKINASRELLCYTNIYMVSEGVLGSFTYIILLDYCRGPCSGVIS